MSMGILCRGLRLERTFNRTLTMEEIGNLSQVEFVNYLLENLWDKISPEKYGKPFDQLTFSEKQNVDMEALIRIGRAFEETGCKRR